MKFYHGTTEQNANSIITCIDVTKGGGELGRGFYMGSCEYSAYQWAFQKANREKSKMAVFAFEIQDDEILSLEIQSLSLQETKKYHSMIKKRNQTSTFLFSKDLVWGFIVGKNSLNHVEQLKFESSYAEIMINKVKKNQIWKKKSII